MKPDELIMLLYDGELSEREAEEARALIAADPSAAALFEQLAVVGENVREAALRAPLSSDLVDAVMARVELDAPVVLEPVRPVTRLRPKRALAFVSGALALAAGLALLVSRGVGPQSLAKRAEVAAPVAAMSAPEPEPPEQSVAIERVDFGGSQGAVFVVPGPDDRTLVIWTLDDAPIWAVDDVADDKGPEVDL
ncbi:MAG: anti-sigma factor family protein [Myxococcota bacterium]